MSGKSIFLSILSIILFAGVIVGLIMIFKANPLLTLVGLLLFFFPVMSRQKALDAADGTVDKIIAKWVVPVLAVILTLFAILSVAFWIK